MTAREALKGLSKRTCPECGGCGEVSDPVAIGKKMWELRLKADLTQREVARRLGLSAMYICDLELGRRGWSAARIDDYLKAISQ